VAKTAGSDRRRVGRRPIPGVVATLRAPGDVRVLDVGVFGLQIEATDELPAGRQLFLELRHGGDTANVEVAVRWSSVSQVVRDRGTLRPLSRAGVEFSEIYRERIGGIWDYILVPPQRPR